jgi:hypothetical protein
VPTAATWTGRDGAVVVGEVYALGGTPAGSVVDAWIDEAGDPARAPSGPVEAFLAGVLSAAMLLALGAAVLAAAWVGARRLVAVLADRYWTREWAAVEPRWRSAGPAGPLCC